MDHKITLLRLESEDWEVGYFTSIMTDLFAKLDQIDVQFTTNLVNSVDEQSIFRIFNKAILDNKATMIKDGADYKLVKATLAQTAINHVDYFTGEQTGSPTSQTKHNLLRLFMGKHQVMTSELEGEGIVDFKDGSVLYFDVDERVFNAFTNINSLINLPLKNDEMTTLIKTLKIDLEREMEQTLTLN